MEKVKLIQGNEERAEEIRKTLEEWSGINKYNFSCNIEENYYYVDPLLSICRWIDEEIAKELISEGKAEIYELPSLQTKCEFEPFDKVLVRDDDNMNWLCDFFSNLETDEDQIADGFIYCTVGGSFKQCVKYEGNEELLGTKNNPK